MNQLGTGASPDFIRPMPQIQLPIFPASCTAITDELAFERRDEQVFYFNGHLPVFSHAASDLASFRLFSSQLIANGTASQAQISRAFGVPLVTVKRACKKLRELGSAGFFAAPAPRQGHRLTPPIIAQAQELLDAGLDVPATGERIGVLPNTLHKAIRAGRLKKKPALTSLLPAPPPPPLVVAAAAAMRR